MKMCINCTEHNQDDADSCQVCKYTVFMPVSIAKATAIAPDDNLNETDISCWNCTESVNPMDLHCWNCNVQQQQSPSPSSSNESIKMGSKINY